MKNNNKDALRFELAVIRARNKKLNSILETQNRTLKACQIELDEQGLKIQRLKSENETLARALDDLSTEIMAISPFDYGIDDNTRDLAKVAESLIEHSKVSE